MKKIAKPAKYNLNDTVTFKNAFTGQKDSGSIVGIFLEGCHPNYIIAVNDEKILERRFGEFYSFYNHKGSYKFAEDIDPETPCRWFWETELNNTILE
jgi:hypothetical protein